MVVGMLAVFTLLLVGVGSLSYRGEVGKIADVHYQTLAAINNLKSLQIQQWRKERAAEIERAAKDSLTIKGAKDELGAPGNLDFQKELQDCLREEMQETEHRSALLFDTQANLLAANDADSEHLYDATRLAIREAIATHAPAFSNFYRASDGEIHIDLAAPVCDRDGKALAVLVLRHEAASYLYPLISSTLTPSDSAETLLVMRDGDEVLYLSDVRHRAGTALSLRLPLGDSTLAAAQVANGQRGIFVGKDYRGIRVICDLRSVADSPWFIESKVDEAEILAEVRAKAAVISLMVGLFILLAAVLVAFYYRGRQTRIMGNLVDAQQRKVEALTQAREVGERHRTILLAAMDGFCLMDAQGRIQEANAAYCRMSGYSEEELLTTGIGDLDVGQSADEVAANIKKIFEGGSAHFESRHRRKDGSDFDVDISVQRLTSDVLMAVFIRDITAKKQARTRIERLSMLYGALSECSKATVHSTSMAGLMPKICRIVVEQGGLKMAWIGMPDAASGRILSVASYGEGLDYLLEVEISVNPEDRMSRGPGGRAFLEGRAMWSHDFQNDLSTAPVRDAGRRFGWKSAACIPLLLRGKPVALLMLYSDTLGAFDEEVRALLMEMADNISFAFDHFAEEDERRRMQAELLVLRKAIEQTASMIVITSPMGDIEYANPAFETITGYSSSEAIGKNPSILKSGEQGPAFYQDLWLAIKSGRVWRGEFHNRRKDGSLYWKTTSISPIVNSNGELIHLVAIKDDTTARKMMETRLLEALDMAEAGNRSKREFLAVMSHELRTPLNGILGAAELLGAPLTHAEREEWVDVIVQSGQALVKLIDDILEFVSIEKLSIELESKPVLIDGLVEIACKRISKAAADKGLDFDREMAPGLPQYIIGDHYRISQILFNLLDNAVKFTPHGSVVLRLASAIVDGREWLEFAVADTGLGIAPGQLASIYNAFTQVNSSIHRTYEGAGLGLAIAKQLAQAMGGSIGVTSVLGQGSTFTLRLPLAPTQQN